MSTPQQPVGASLVVLFDRDRRLLFEHPEAVGKAFSKEYVERELYPRHSGTRKARATQRNGVHSLKEYTACSATHRDLYIYM